MKKAVKKIISLLLITILVFSALPITVSAAETSTDIPEYVDYQAGRYSNQFNMIFGDGSDSFANTYYKTMKNNESVISGVAIWEAAHIVTSPSYFLDSGLISKKDMYKLAIFDMLDITESSTFASNLANVLQDERLSYIVSVTKAVCDPQDIKVSELKNFEVTGEYINFLEEGAKNAKALDVAGNIQKIVDVCDNLYEAVNTIATYQTISNMKNGYAEILEAIAKDDKNPWDLREAANDCVVYTNKSFDTTLSRLINNPELFTNPTIESVLKLSVDYLWDQIKSAIPGGTVVLAAASGMRVLSNAVFKMDDTCRTYYELETDVNLENAVRRVMDNSKYDFTQNKSRDNATSYMQAVNMYKRVVLQGYDYVINMLEVKASAPATQWFDWFNHDYSECIKLIDDIGNSKETKKHLYDQFEEWVLDDYNKLYQSDYNKTINAFNNQQTLHASSVSLSQIKEIHSGDNGYIYDYIKKTCQPENSTEYKKCFFTADNKDIFTIDKLGSFVAEAPGQVTLTYDEGGALETSITITIGESSEEEPYDYLSDFEYSVDINKRVTITGYNGTRSNLIIPREIKGYSVTSIDNDAFRGCTSLTSITIPDSVTSIDNDAFRGCTSLTSITIPNSVTSIGDGAFRCCSSLTSINIPDGVTSIGSSAFEGCSSLTSINIPDGVTSIGSSAFEGCSSLTSINIPDGVTSIGNGTFDHCSSLTSINIPDIVKSIGDGAFRCCSSLTSINIPDGVTSIGDDAFRFCSSLTSINIPDGVTSIGNDAFSYCNSLTSINIPDGVTSIGDDAFTACESLTSINIPDGVTSIGNDAFSYCYNLSDVFYSNSDTEWSNISIGSDNDYLASANIHYNTSSDDYFETSRTEADCTTDGVIEYKCPHGYTKTEKIPAYGHNFINGMCSRCEKNELECFESAHPYEDNCDKSWTINKSGAKSVSITFSSQTEVEDGYDYIEIYDGKDNLIGSYTGTALASQCITVTGDTAIIRLTSDSSNSYYGFSIDSIDYVAEPNALSVGDVNGDGEITILDATCIQKYIAQLEDFTDKQKEVADVNGDGTISVMDSTQIQKYIVQLIDTLG